MSIMMAIGGLAPMVAPVLGGTVLTLGGTWRTVFWFLVGFGLLMMITAIVFVPRVTATGTSSRRRTASVRIRAEPGATDPLVRRLHADRGVVRRHDDGVYSELLLRAAGAERPEAPAVRAVLRLHRPGPDPALGPQRQDRRPLPAVHSDRVVRWPSPPLSPAPAAPPPLSP